MKKLMVSAFALAMMTTGAMAGEQLTTAQLDQVTAGFFDRQTNVNFTKQKAVAVAVNRTNCAIAVCGGGAAAQAGNWNSTTQFNID